MAVPNGKCKHDAAGEEQAMSERTATTSIRVHADSIDQKFIKQRQPVDSSTQLRNVARDGRWRLFRYLSSGAARLIDRASAFCSYIPDHTYFGRDAGVEDRPADAP